MFRNIVHRGVKNNLQFIDVQKLYEAQNKIQNNKINFRKYEWLLVLLAARYRIVILYYSVSWLFWSGNELNVENISVF